MRILQRLLAYYSVKRSLCSFARHRLQVFFLAVRVRHCIRQSTAPCRAGLDPVTAVTESAVKEPLVASNSGVA